MPDADETVMEICDFLENRGALFKRQYLHWVALGKDIIERGHVAYDSGNRSDFIKVTERLLKYDGVKKECDQEVLIAYWLKAKENGIPERH